MTRSRRERSSTITPSATYSLALTYSCISFRVMVWSVSSTLIRGNALLIKWM